MGNTDELVLCLLSSNLNESKFISLPSQFNQKFFWVYFQKLMTDISGAFIKYFWQWPANKSDLGLIFGKAEVLSQTILPVLPCFACAPCFLTSVVWVNTTTTITTTALLKVLGFGVVFQTSHWKEVMNSSDETAIFRQFV